jgi:imidazolonepropionase-like amidohydrolase
LLDVTGTVEPGKQADLLILAGDPLADIRVLTDRTRIAGILKGGAWVSRRGVGSRE